MKDIVWFTILLTTALNNFLLLSKINIYTKKFLAILLSHVDSHIIVLATSNVNLGMRRFNSLE